VGGMSEALSRHADEALADLPGANTQLTAGTARSLIVAEKLFKALTEKGPDNREIRRPAALGEICATAEANTEEVITVIETFRRPGRSFLMPPAGIPLTSEALIDISHESLIRGWSRLKEWVEEESRSARIYRRVAETAVLEKEGGAGLWRDPDLQIALTWRQKAKPNEAWAQRYHREFDLAMSFVDRSVVERDREIKERESQRKKSIRRTRWTAMVFGILFVFSLVALVVAVRQTAKANSAFAQLRDSSEHAKQDAVEREKDRIAKANAEKERQAAEAFAAEAKRLRDIAEEEKQKALAQAAKVARLEQQARKEANEANEINDLTHKLNEALRRAKAEEVVTHGSMLAGRYRNKTKPDALGEYETQTILGSAYLELNRNSDARSAARRALEIQGSAAINNSRNRHENLSVLRDAYLKESDKAESRENKTQYLAEAFQNGVDALTLLRADDLKVTNANDPALISDLSRLVLISEKLGQFPNSEKYGEQIVQVQQNIVTAALEDLTRYLDDQADFNKAHGNYEKAEYYLKRIVLMQEKLLDPNDPKLVATLSELADVYRAAKKDSVADQVVQRIQRIEGKEALLRRGSSGAEVTKLQELLKARGFYTGNADGYFGLSTEVAATNFQASVGLQADGIVGPATLQRLATPQAATPGTRDIQAALKQLGFYPLSVDGSFGMATKAALMSFQRSKGLNADGNVNAETLIALGLTPVTAPVTGKITVDVVSKMFPNIPVENIKANLPDILHALEDEGLTDKEIALMAIATVGIETGGTFEPTEERKSRFNTSAEGYAFDLYDNRLDLGNEGPPDGERFKGRGYIQLTGRANYKRYGTAIGIGDELIKNPELAANASVAAKIFVQYLKGFEKQIKAALVAGDFMRARRSAGLGTGEVDQFTKAYQTGVSLIQ
jgi:peptidoglycan hydrolase-like protein with peptidoglycan-binding domain